MKLKMLTLASLIAVSSTSFAQEYQFFSNGSFSNFSDIDFKTYSVDAAYYFSPIESLGPLNEFDFLITESNISGSYIHADAPFGSANSYGVSGNLFYGDFLIGGSYIDSNDEDFSNLRLGYLLTPKLLLALNLPNEGEADAIVDVTYQHDLANNAYLGFSASVDSEFDNQSVGVRYFSPISSGQYMALSASYFKSDNSSADWVIGGDYYFNKNTSIGAQLNDGFVVINAGHFFNAKFSVKGSYTFADDTFTGDSVTLTASYQF